MNQKRQTEVTLCCLLSLIPLLVRLSCQAKMVSSSSSSRQTFRFDQQQEELLTSYLLPQSLLCSFHHINVSSTSSSSSPMSPWEDIVCSPQLLVCDKEGGLLDEGNGNGSGPGSGSGSGSGVVFDHIEEELFSSLSFLLKTSLNKKSKSKKKKGRKGEEDEEDKHEKEDEDSPFNQPVLLVTPPLIYTPSPSYASQLNENNNGLPTNGEEDENGGGISTFGQGDSEIQTWTEEANNLLLKIQKYMNNVCARCIDKGKRIYEG